MFAKSVLMLAIFVLSIGTSSAAAPLMQEGLWEILMRMDIPGVPVAKEPAKYRHCYTKEDVSNIEKQLVGSSEKQGKCTLVDKKITGNKVNYSVSCQGDKANTLSVGEVIYSGTSFQGKTTTEISDNAHKPMKMTQQFNAKRIGDCTKKNQAKE